MHLPPEAVTWLGDLHRKLGAADDWSRGGQPNRYWSEDPYPTQLVGVGVAVACLAPCTPAWIEPYLDLLDRLIDRYTSWQGAADFLVEVTGRPGHRTVEADPVLDRANIDYGAGLALLLGLRAAIAGEQAVSDPRPSAAATVEVVRERQYRFEWSHSALVNHLDSQERSELVDLALWANGRSAEPEGGSTALRHLIALAPVGLCGPAMAVADAALRAADCRPADLVAVRPRVPRIQGVNLDLLALRRAEWVEGCLHVGLAPWEEAPTRRALFQLVGDEPRMWYLTGIEGTGLDTAGAAVVVNAPLLEGELVFAPSSY